MPGETDRRPRLRPSGPGPHGAVSYLSICSVLRGEERGFADQRGLTPSWGMGIIIGLLLPLAMEPIRHFPSPGSPLPCWLQLRR